MFSTTPKIDAAAVSHLSDSKIVIPPQFLSLEIYTYRRDRLSSAVVVIFCELQISQYVKPIANADHISALNP